MQPRERRDDAPPQPADLARTPASPVDARALEELRQLVDGNDAALTALIRQYVWTAESHCRALRAAAAARDAAVLAREAHALKGSSGHFGARSLSDLCQRLEDFSSAGRADDCEALLTALETEFARVRAALGGDVPADEPTTGVAA